MATKRRDPEAFLRKLWALEALLVKAGFPAMPEWWRREIARFYRSGKRRWVIRKGRRVFASTCIAPRLAVAEMLYGEHQHLPGTPPLTYAFLSVRNDEAGKRLRGVTAILDVLGEPYAPRGDTVELQNRPAVFAVVTANFRTSVGDTVAFAWGDEVSRMRDAETGANPAAEVFGSLAPALATLPDAKMFLVSSPLGIDDYHAKLFEQGDTNAQCVSFGATWEINPSLSEQTTRDLEPDERIWRREYAAIPQASLSAAFDPDHVKAAFGKQWRQFDRPGIITIDASSGADNSFVWTYCGWQSVTLGNPLDHLGVDVYRDTEGNDVTGWYEMKAPGVYARDADGRPIWRPGMRRAAMPQLAFGRFFVVDGSGFGSILLDEICAQIADLYHRSGARWVVGDRYQDVGVEALLRQHDVRFKPVNVSNQSKGMAVVRLRRLLADGQVTFYEPDERVERELVNFKEVIRAGSSTIRYSGKQGGQQDDRVGAILNALIAEQEDLLPGSPTQWISPEQAARLENTRHQQWLLSGQS